MKIGVPKEIKNHERRVGLTPTSASELVRRGHNVLVETQAGVGVGASDEDYRNVGCDIAGTAEDVFALTELIIKVKEPQAIERAMLRPEQTLFTYLHLAPDAPQAKDLVESGATCIAYETVTDNHGGLPLLAPMSKVAGRMSIQAAANFLQAPNGGAGLLIGGVPGVAPAKVVIIGGGVVGQHAAEMAMGLGGDVTILDRNTDVLDHCDARWGASVSTIYSTAADLERLVTDADVVVGAVLVRGHKAPKLVTAEMIKGMRPGSVVVDVAIDQGGAFETSHATTHEDPVYLVDGVVHYAVANMPGAVPKTSTYALNNSTLPFILALADMGPRAAMEANVHLRNGLNVSAGNVTEPNVAEALGYAYLEPEAAVAALPN
ncbi:MAG: alanine dehydrogenase [Acidimicrobiales bacterium]|nr:alanine dehydrogenase [Acidimicrobiia bacterium]NNC81225.1 alanine dehydrogenase [Acidimicrobiales bacterium]RZV44442.1 MAG: alanine dehydrogenase [Acidimicrobiales bacterium]